MDICHRTDRVPLWYFNIAMENCHLYWVCTSKDGDSPSLSLCLPEGNYGWWALNHTDHIPSRDSMVKSPSTMRSRTPSMLRLSSADQGIIFQYSHLFKGCDQRFFTKHLGNFIRFHLLLLWTGHMNIASQVLRPFLVFKISYAHEYPPTRSALSWWKWLLTF